MSLDEQSSLAAPSYPVRRGYSHLRTGWQSLSLADRMLVAYFLVLDWGIPFPFRLAAEAESAPGIEEALSGVVSTRGTLQIIAWAGLALLVWLRMAQTGRIGFFRVLLLDPPGVCWLMFIVAQMISILYSPSPLLCIFRVFQSVVLTIFLTYWFYYERGRCGSVLIGAVVCFSAANSLYNIVMYVVYPDAVVAWDPTDGDRLIGGWLFQADYSYAGLLVFTFCLTSLYYCRENRRLYALGLAIAGMEMMLSATRGVLFSAVVVVCLGPWLRARDPIRRAFLLAGAGTVLLSVFVFSNDLNEWMGRNPRSMEGLDGRQDAWVANTEDFFREGSIAFGLGYLTGGRFLASRSAYRGLGDMHNMYLEALVDTGIVGLFALTLFLVMLLFSARILRRWQNLASSSDHDKFVHRDLAFCWLSLVTVLLLGVISRPILSEGALGLTTVLIYLMVVMHFERTARKHPLGTRRIRRSPVG